MSSNEEYNSLVRQKSAKQAEYRAAQDRIEECDYLLGRLRRAKEVIQAQKKEFKNIKKRDEDLVEDKCDWTGSNYDRYRSKGGSMLAEDEFYLKNSLDTVLDNLNNEITRIENQKYNEYGLLGRLSSAINSLANKIENFFN